MILNGPQNAAWTLVLAHGAGQGMDSPFMTAFAEGLSRRGAGVGGLQVVRFEFPYRQAMRRDGRRRPPNRQDQLIDAWHATITWLLQTGVPYQRLAIGGKSLGGRIATLVADQVGIAAVVCLGYPFHPPGKSTQTRTEHLRTLRTPTLICQGTRDPLGTRDEVQSYPLSGSIRFCWLEEADHSFKPRAGTGFTQSECFHQAMQAILTFIDERSRPSPKGTKGVDGPPP